MAVEDPALPPFVKKRMLEAMGSPRAAKIAAKGPLIPQSRAICADECVVGDQGRSGHASIEQFRREAREFLLR